MYDPLRQSYRADNASISHSATHTHPNVARTVTPSFARCRREAAKLLEEKRTRLRRAKKKAACHVSCWLS